jgi:Ca2+-binding EF-hand superfamily protein
MFTIATHCSDEEIAGMHENFRSLDTDGSGSISLAEFKSGLSATALQDQELK